MLFGTFKIYRFFNFAPKSRKIRFSHFCGFWTSLETFKCNKLSRQWQLFTNTAKNILSILHSYLTCSEKKLGIWGIPAVMKERSSLPSKQGRTKPRDLRDGGEIINASKAVKRIQLKKAESVNTADGEHLIHGRAISPRWHGISPHRGCLCRPVRERG